jgi:Kdo2-lipid IVA lauroyltransferase/acyltransferase
MARQVGSLRASVEFAALALPWGMLRTLPLKRAVRVGAALGSVAATFDLMNRAIAGRNLEIAFPEMDGAAHRHLLRGTYRNFGRLVAEWVHFFDLDRDNIEAYVTYAGRDHWEQAIGMSDGRGILILTGHFGNFELLSLAHSICGNRVAIVHRPNRNPIVNTAVNARRGRFGNITVPRRGAGREVVRLLRDNWMVAVPLDQDTRHGIFVDFFSKKASTSDGLARLAMATGAPVLPAFMVREGSTTRHRITFLPVIQTVRTRDRVESVRENTQHFTGVIERMIRSYPDQWNWIHRRWKTRPPGEERLY